MGVVRGAARGVVGTQNCPHQHTPAAQIDGSNAESFRNFHK